MAEQVDLPTPITKTQTKWELDEMTLSARRRLIEIRLVGQNGEALTVLYPTPPPVGSSQPSGQTLLTALNKANLTTNSLMKRVFTQLIADGHIVGTVTGTPE